MYRATGEVPTRNNGLNAKISKKYLYANEISNYDELPEELGSGALNSLNEKHGYTLRWKLLESKVTDTDILELEKRIQIKIPNVLKDYLQSYALPLPFITGTISADVSETYCEETDKWRTLEFEDEFATATLRLAPMPLNYELLVFENLNKYFINRRYIYFGTLEMFFLWRGLRYGLFEVCRSVRTVICIKV